MTAELPEDLQKTYRAQIPLGRFASPDEVAERRALPCQRRGGAT